MLYVSVAENVNIKNVGFQLVVCLYIPKQFLQNMITVYDANIH